MIAKLKEEEEKLKEAENKIAVMNMLKEGAVPETVAIAAGTTLQTNFSFNFFCFYPFVSCV